MTARQHAEEASALLEVAKGSETALAIAAPIATAHALAALALAATEDGYGGVAVRVPGTICTGRA